MGKIWFKYVTIFLLTGLVQSCSFNGDNVSSVSRFSGKWIPENNSEIQNEKIAITYKGQTYSINESFQGDRKFKYGVDNSAGRHALMAVDGENVKAILLYGSDDAIALGLKGENTQYRPIGEVQYQGEFRFVSAKDVFLSNQSQPVKIMVDFDRGVIKGSSSNNDYFSYETQFRGVLHEDYVEIIFNDETGIHHGEGDFFGEKGEELFAYYTADEHGGVLYAIQD